jgi:hypothetical protein
MPDASIILALIAAAVYIAATVLNIVAIWRHRFDRITVTWIFSGMALVSIWNAVGYLLIVAGLFPFNDPPLNIILLRPAQIIVGGIFCAVPGWVLTVRETIGHTEELHEIISHARECQEQLRHMNNSLIDAKQTIEIYTSAYDTLKRRVEELEQQIK